MSFETLFNKISPRLKRIARNHNGHGHFIDQEDLYQEMCIYLWNNYKYGLPAGINDAYAVRGCEFHILNYLKKEREKAVMVSLETPINEEGGTLKDILEDTEEPLSRRIDKKMTVDEINNNGFSVKEKEIFSLLLHGYTVREAGEKLGISHVMVVKHKNNIIKKWHKKVTKTSKNLLI